MTSRRLSAVIGMVLWVCAALPALAADRIITIAYVDRAGDPYYQPVRGYEGIAPVAREPAISGAALAVKDAKILQRALQAKFELVHRTLQDGETVEAALSDLTARGAVAAVLDLPEAEVEAAARAGMIALFNIRHTGSALRARTCNTRLFHVIPSDPMYADALAQFLRAAGWMEVLVLASAAPDDQRNAAAFAASAAKFGLTISGSRQFVEGNDPRQREMNNIKLLTGGVSYDAVYIADAARDFARTVPYNTLLARPVAGAAGLRPLAWHSLWERQGAPQLNRRFWKLAGRAMTEQDWAAWVAVKAAIAAKVKSAAAVDVTLQEPDFAVELYKGFPGSFRPWDHQLRQAMLLATETAVSGLAPVEGALHQFNTLDTLGLDEPEFACAQ